MERKRKKLFKATIAFAVALAFVLPGSAAFTSNENVEENDVNIIKIDKTAQKTTMQCNDMAVPFKHMAKPLDVSPAFQFELDQLHPGFGRSILGMHMATYWDEDYNNIIWTFSADDGASYDPGVVYNTPGGDYPSIKLWDDAQTRFFGTFVTDPDDYDGGPVYLFECTDPSDYDSYSLVSWPWDLYGWYDMIDSEIACDSSQASWEWGFISFVGSTTYTIPTTTEGPFIMYQTSSSGGGMISWYGGIKGCSHTDADIDHVTYDTYALYDWYDSEYSADVLLVRLDHFDNWDAPGDLIEIVGEGNLQYPAVAVNDDNLVILAETDENGNKDIICFYSDAGLNNIQSSLVASSTDDEMYPDVRHINETKFVCTFVMNETLYKSISKDGGATWSEPGEISGDAVEEYKTADICDYGTQALFEFDNGDDVDIWLENDLGAPPPVPILEIASLSGGIGVSAVIKNIGNSDATNVNWSITVKGGILGFIRKTVDGIIPTLAVDEESDPLETGLLLGLGSIDVTVTAICDEGSSATNSTDGWQIIIFTWIK